MEEKANTIKNNLLSEIESANNLQDIVLLKSKYIGKNGSVTEKSTSKIWKYKKEHVPLHRKP